MSSLEHNTYSLRVTGVVQGVGFRPFVYQLASSMGLAGIVGNDASGVFVEINADELTCKSFAEAIRSDAPPLASVDTITYQTIQAKTFSGFSIIESDQEGVRTTLIPPDICVCEACKAELFDPQNRRYLYPFITCTNCGVRYSIIKTLPYDRKHTSMEAFEMCEACAKEYGDPSDRRYHAQPIGCYDCGPKLRVLDTGGRVEMKEYEMIGFIASQIEDGKIVAVKGVGGYHLVCDATNEAAVKKLRERKHRPTKPYAVMVKDSERAKALAYMNDQERSLLDSKERPIVLLRRKKSSSIAPSVAPNISKIGLFLPYTPLHLLLLETLDRPLVATSANITDEPICTTYESLAKLNGVYDYILDHNRAIVNGCDDSVVTIVEGRQLMLRRARGFAPSSIKLPFKLPQKVLAMGANQKSTIAIGFENEAILSPHIGDLDTIESVGYFAQNIETLRRVYNFTPDVVIHDKHPGYESSKYAKAHYTHHQEVQHHYAHILGVMAEKQCDGKVLGAAFDGTGYGDDGTLWGGEFLVCDYQSYDRVGYLKPFKLLGGAKAIKEPRRVALSLLFDLYGEAVLVMDLPTVKSFSPAELKVHYLAWQKGLNAPISSSIGRLFDAVASLTDVCHMMSFEGESGMLLEELYDETIHDYYQFEILDRVIDVDKMLVSILNESNTQVAVSKFFNTLIEIITTMREKYDLPLVVSGGVFQNSVLLGLLIKRCPDMIFSSAIPPNDGGIALGQVVSSQTL